MWKRYVSFAVAVVLLSAFGALVPLTVGRRLTLTGIVVSFTGIGLGVFAASFVSRQFGVAPAVAVGVGTNFAIAAFWFWLVFRATVVMRGEKPVA